MDTDLVGLLALIAALIFIVAAAWKIVGVFEAMAERSLEESQKSLFPFDSEDDDPVAGLEILATIIKTLAEAESIADNSTGNFDVIEECRAAVKGQIKLIAE